MRFDEDGALENSTDITNLLVVKFNISMETTGDDASCLNETIKDTEESLITWLYQALFIGINMKKW